MNKRLSDSVARILYEDTKTKLTKDNIKDSTARAAASILEAPIVSKKLDKSGPQRSAAEILYEAIREKSQTQDSAARIAAEILKTSPVTTQMIAESGATISDALNFEPKIKTEDEAIFYNKKRKEISEEVQHEIEALESKFESLENTLAEDLRKYKQNITEAVSTTKTNYAGTDSGGGEVRILNMDDIETKDMGRQAKVAFLANNATLTYNTSDRKFHLGYALNQNLLQSSNALFNNINTTGNISIGGTIFASSGVTGNIDLNVSGNASVGKNLIVTGNTILQGNLLVTGYTTTVNTNSLIVSDAMFHLNDISTVSNVDLGFTGNYNDGTYRHAGLFRDSNDGVWKFFDGYTPETNVATKIYTANVSYVDAALKVGNLTANGTVTVTSNVTAGNFNTVGVANVGNSIVTGLTASKPVFTDANKALTSSGTMPTNQGGTGLTSFTTNGLVYASSTSALATGSTLQFDGTNFGVGVTPVSNNGVLQLGSYAAIKSLVETATITGAAPASTTQFDWATQAVQYYTSNATTNFTLNIRGNGSTSLNTIMQTGQSASIALLVTNGSPAYYMSAINIDGTASGVTVKYINGNSITTGNANSIDIYSITVIKTGSATYTVLVSQTKFG
jgi:hypothetical protein